MISFITITLDNKPPLLSPLSSPSALLLTRNKQEPNNELTTDKVYARYAKPSKIHKNLNGKPASTSTIIPPPAIPSTSAIPPASSAPLTVTNLLNSSDIKPIVPKISELGDNFKTSVHSTSSSQEETHSDHSGGSGATITLDEAIDFVDA